jgi:hypothetical protein
VLISKEADMADPKSNAAPKVAVNEDNAAVDVYFNGAYVRVEPGAPFPTSKPAAPVAASEQPLTAEPKEG